MAAPNVKVNTEELRKANTQIGQITEGIGTSKTELLTRLEAIYANIVSDAVVPKLKAYNETLEKICANTISALTEMSGYLDGQIKAYEAGTEEGSANIAGTNTGLTGDSTAAGTAIAGGIVAAGLTSDTGTGGAETGGTETRSDGGSDSGRSDGNKTEVGGGVSTDNNTSVDTDTQSNNSNDDSNSSNGGRLTRSGGVFQGPSGKETWYSQKVLPGGGLDIPGRHVAADGTIRDKDNYIVIASDELPKGTVAPTSLGEGKVYDTGVGHSGIDIYTNW